MATIIALMNGFLVSQHIDIVGEFVSTHVTHRWETPCFLVAFDRTELSVTRERKDLVVVSQRNPVRYDRIVLHVHMVF